MYCPLSGTILPGYLHHQVVYLHAGKEDES